MTNPSSPPSQEHIREFSDCVFTGHDSEAQALRWVLAQDGWECSRISRITVGHVALVWRWKKV